MGKSLSLLKDGTHGSYESVQQGAWLLSAKNIINNRVVITSNDRKISENDFKKIHDKFQLRKGDVLLTIVGTIGRSAILKEANKLTFQRSVAYLRPDENILTSSNFLFSLSKSSNFQNQLKKRTVISAQPGIYLSDIDKLNITIPELKEEQDKIASIIITIDSILSLQQRKLEQLKQLKKAMLQQLFVDKNSKQPNLRFKNFNGDWKQRKGKSIFYSKSNKDFPELTVLSATQDKGMVPRSSTGIGIKYEKKSLRGYKKVEPGDFIVHLRSFQGGFAYSDLTGIVSPAYTVFTFKQPEMFNNYFWKEKFTSYNFIQLLKKVTYGVRDGRSISYSDFLTLNEKFPVEVEQTKIADLFKKINNLIAFQQNKLTQLTTLKKYLLQKLFI